MSVFRPNYNFQFVIQHFVRVTYLIGSALICCSNMDIVASRSPGGGTGTPTPRAIPPTPTPQCAGKLMAVLMLPHADLSPPA